MTAIFISHSSADNAAAVEPKRPPYPCLLAFQETDAAIFFGRGEEILKTLETLDALRREGREAAAKGQLYRGVVEGIRPYPYPWPTSNKAVYACYTPKGSKQ